MSLINDYLNAISVMKKDRMDRYEADYANWQQDEANKSKMFGTMVGLGIGALTGGLGGLPFLGIEAGAGGALAGAGLSLIPGGLAMGTMNRASAKAPEKTGGGGIADITGIPNKPYVTKIPNLNLGERNTDWTQWRESPLEPYSGWEYRAEGGEIKKGKPYLVGERGAEVIVPAEDGEVISNEDLRKTEKKLFDNDRAIKTIKKIEKNEAISAEDMFNAIFWLEKRGINMENNATWADAIKLINSPPKLEKERGGRIYIDANPFWRKKIKNVDK